METNLLQNISFTHAPTSKSSTHTIVAVERDDDQFSPRTYVLLNYNLNKWWSVHPHYGWGEWGINMGNDVELIPMTDEERDECCWAGLDYTHWMISYFQNDQIAAKLPVR